MEECVKQLGLGFKLNNFILIKNRFKVEVKNCKSIQLKDEDPDPLDYCQIRISHFLFDKFYL